MKPHGVTLLETLAALVLLGFVTAALVGITRFTAESQRITTDHHEWSFAAEAALDAIAKDLSLFQEDQRSGARPRVAIDDGMIRVATRSEGRNVEVRYIQNDRGDLLRVITPIRGERSQVSSLDEVARAEVQQGSILLQHVATFDIGFTQPSLTDWFLDEADAGLAEPEHGVLAIAITRIPSGSRRDARASRAFRILPPEPPRESVGGGT